MSDSRSPIPDSERSRFRTIVATMEREIALLPIQAAADDSGATEGRLRACWADLVEALALGPEPAMRECPVCKHLGRRAATLCAYCWTRLAPLPVGNGVAEH